MRLPHYKVTILTDYGSEAPDNPDEFVEKLRDAETYDKLASGIDAIVAGETDALAKIKEHLDLSGNFGNDENLKNFFKTFAPVSSLLPKISQFLHTVKDLKYCWCLHIYTRITFVQ